MQLKEIILQTRQSLQAAVNSNWDLVDRHPPVTHFQLAPDIQITELDSQLAEQVMDCCDS